MFGYIIRFDCLVATNILLLSDITTKLERNIVEEKDIKIVSEIIEVIAQHSGSPVKPCVYPKIIDSL